ncbi:DUF2157 domain-containing protein [Flavobacterium sp. GCM10027622]|uniref:DUF2157 domain-containing protein n=1 Tax=unclassified Flavobacterium TaxID=196869 RepID=UPI003622452A
MSNNILKELPELLSNGIITDEVAAKITDYYNRKASTNPNRLFTIFGILGALLGGLGIILIVAHNWDNFSITTKTVVAFIPLVLGQVACWYTLNKLPNSITWKESSATFLVFAIAATISLIAQIYNLPEDMEGFLLTWIVLSLPLVYIMRSSFTSLLAILGIVWYCSEAHYDYPKSNGWIHWLLLLTLVPHYYNLIKNHPSSNFTRFHHWFFAGSLLFCLPSISKEPNTLMLIGFASLLAIFYLIGKQNFFLNNNQNRNAYWLIGKAGTLFLLFILSFKFPWNEIGRENEKLNQLDSLVWITLFITAIVLLYIHLKKTELLKINPVSLGFVLITILYSLAGNENAFIITVVNIFVLAIGVSEIRNGAESNSLYKLNFGLLIISILTICRFFDTNMSFVVRGVLFIGIGLGFFLMNYYLLKKRKQNEN